jgi:hypothetical protein
MCRNRKETIPLDLGAAVPVRKSEELVSNAKAGTGQSIQLTILAIGLQKHTQNCAKLNAPVCHSTVPLPHHLYFTLL